MLEASGVMEKKERNNPIKGKPGQKQPSALKKRPLNQLRKTRLQILLNLPKKSLWRMKPPQMKPPQIKPPQMKFQERLKKSYQGLGCKICL